MFGYEYLCSALVKLTDPAAQIWKLYYKRKTLLMDRRIESYIIPNIQKKILSMFVNKILYGLIIGMQDPAASVGNNVLPQYSQMSTFKFLHHYLLIFQFFTWLMISALFGSVVSLFLHFIVLSVPSCSSCLQPNRHFFFFKWNMQHEFGALSLVLILFLTAPCACACVYAHSICESKKLLPTQRSVAASVVFHTSTDIPRCHRHSPLPQACVFHRHVSTLHS